MTTTNDHGEREHASCSPSTLKNRSVCPSYQPEQSDEVHPVTAQGTKCHEAAETWNYDGLDDEETAMVKTCETYVKTATDGALKVTNEPVLKTHLKNVWGYADVEVLHTEFSASIIDYKFGWNYQGDAKENLQGIAYTVGVFEKYPKVETVTVHFLYPRLDIITLHAFHRSDLKKLKVGLSLIAGKVDLAKANLRRETPDTGPEFFNPDPENCLYCGLKTQCPVVGQLALTTVRKFDPETEGLSLVHPENIKDPRQMSLALRWGPLLEKWSKEVRQWALLMRMEDGVEIPGYDLAYRSNKMTIQNPVDALELAKEYDCTDEEFAGCCTVSAAQLAKVAEKSAPPRKKKVWNAKFREELVERGIAREPEEITYLKADKDFDVSTLMLEQEKDKTPK